MASQNKRPRPSNDNESSQFNFSLTKFLVIKSEEAKPITSLSPFIIEKQIESLIGTPKSVKKLKNELLLVETSKASQADSLLKVKKFFNLKVTVSEHNSLNKSRGIVKDRTLKGETEENIVEYLAPQGVIACKRFRIKKDNVQVDTNTLLLTFNSTTLPPSIKIFYRTVPVEQFIPNPLRCFNCQKFGHHEDNCKLTDAVICDRCGESKHTSSICQRPFKCVNCGKEHSARSTECEVWKREKEIMRIKTIRKISYFEAKKQYELSFEPRYSKIVQSATAKPQTRTCGTQYDPLDFKQDTKYPSKSTSSSVPKPQSSETDTKSNQTKESSRSRSAHRSSSCSRSPNKNQKSKPDKKEKDKQSNRQKKGSQDPIKLANRYENLEDMELEIDSSVK